MRADLTITSGFTESLAEASTQERTILDGALTSVVCPTVTLLACSVKLLTLADTTVGNVNTVPYEILMVGTSAVIQPSRMAALNSVSTNFATALASAVSAGGVLTVSPGSISSLAPTTTYVDACAQVSSTTAIVKSSTFSTKNLVADLANELGVPVNHILLKPVLDPTKSITFSGGPTCTDGKKNGDETMPDCGGSCIKSCNNDILTRIEKTFAVCITAVFLIGLVMTGIFYRRRAVREHHLKELERLHEMAEVRREEKQEIQQDYYFSDPTLVDPWNQTFEVGL
jgi:ferredoxin